MKITVERFAFKKNYTIGRMYLDGKFFCDTLEDYDRKLDYTMSLDEIKKIKVKNETAIPTGTYNVTINEQSPRFKSRSQYAFCNGKLPRLKDVPGYEGVLIHIGNKPSDTSGCILVGENKAVGQVLYSTKTFGSLYEKLAEANRKGEQILIEIKRK